MSVSWNAAFVRREIRRNRLFAESEAEDYRIRNVIPRGADVVSDLPGHVSGPQVTSVSAHVLSDVHRRRLREPVAAQRRPVSGLQEAGPDPVRRSRRAAAQFLHPGLARRSRRRQREFFARTRGRSVSGINLRFVLSLAQYVYVFIGPIPWGHSGPLCHALSLSSSLSLSMSSWTSMRRRRATVPLATSAEWA